jgi:glucokinase
VGAETFFQLLHSLGVEAAGDVQSVGGAQLAVPAPFDYETGISRMTHKLPFLAGVDLRGALAARFRWKPDQVRFLHDAAAFLLGEMVAGAARGSERAVGITLGTGIGAAFSLSGRVITYGAGVPPDGEIWDLPFASGIFEDFLSARAIQREYRRRTGSDREVIALAAAADNDPAVRETFLDFGRCLGRALRTLLADFSPNVVVLGGGISHAARLFLPSAQCEMEGLTIRLEVSAMPDSAALVGAAAAWFNGGEIAGNPYRESHSVPVKSDGA